MPMNTGFNAPSGPFGPSPFDSGMNMPGNLWNYGNEGGLKHYVIMCKDDVEVRASPTYADDTRVGHFLHPGQVVIIDERRMVNGSWFLHLADGRGWCFESPAVTMSRRGLHQLIRMIRELGSFLALA